MHFGSELTLMCNFILPAQTEIQGSKVLYGWQQEVKQIIINVKEPL